MSIDISPRTEINDVSVTQLLTGIVSDAQDLGVKHLELFRSELLGEIHKTIAAFVALAIGFVLIQVGGLLIGQMLALMLVQFVPTLSLWQSYAIVGIFVLGVGAIPLAIGISRLRALRSLAQGTTRVSS